MSGNKRNPTNTDIIRRIDDMQSSITAVVQDVETLKEWRIAVMAVDEYKRREGYGNNPSTTKGSNEWLNRELVKTLGIALAVILALVTLAQGLVK